MAPGEWEQRWGKQICYQKKVSRCGSELGTWRGSQGRWITAKWVTYILHAWLHGLHVQRGISGRFVDIFPLCLVYINKYEFCILTILSINFNSLNMDILVVICKYLTSENGIVCSFQLLYLLILTLGLLCWQRMSNTMLTRRGYFCIVPNSKRDIFSVFRNLERCLSGKNACSINMRIQERVPVTPTLGRRQEDPRDSLANESSWDVKLLVQGEKERDMIEKDNLISVSTYTHTQIHSYTHTLAHTHSYTHTHTHTHSLS